eukprot:9526321-Karenia_brevis.AAC.1
MLNLKQSHVLLPAPNFKGASLNEWEIVASPQEEDIPSKSGKTDESVLVGDLNPAAAIVLSKLYHKSFKFLFPGLTLPKYELHFRDAVKDLKLADLCVSPH